MGAIAGCSRILSVIAPTAVFFGFPTLAEGFLGLGVRSLRYSGFLVMLYDSGRNKCCSIDDIPSKSLS